MVNLFFSNSNSNSKERRSQASLHSLCFLSAKRERRVHPDWLIVQIWASETSLVNPLSASDVNKCFWKKRKFATQWYTTLCIKVT